MAAGSNIGLNANLSTASIGSFSAAYTLTVGDDASITGHTNQNVTLNLAGRVRNNGTIYWTAAGDSAWDLSHTKTNWTDLSLSDVYLEGDTVVFNDAQNPSGSRSVTLNNSVTPASVSVNHSTGSDYTISGSGDIGGSGGLTKAGSGKFTLSTNNTYSGGTTVNDGTLVVGHVNALGTGGLAINSTATTQLQAGLSGPVQLPTLSIAGGSSPTATLDITDNNMIVHNGDLSALTAQAKAGLSGGFDWNGTGLTSTTARDDSNFATAVGVIQNDDGGGGAFYSSWPAGADSGGAVSVSQTDVLIKYTYYGDADLDGVVTSGQDYDLWLFGKSGGGTGWEFGDFDYDGSITGANDYDLWLYGKSVSAGNPLGGGGGVQPVPEPSTLLLAALGLAGVAAFARRRRAETAPI